MTPSASSVPRALRCPSSLVLPRRRFESAYADAGIEYHEGVESAIDVGDEDGIPDDVLALIGEGDECITERAFAYDVATDAARELELTGRRAYVGLGPFEIPGTPDLVIRHRDGRVTVVDHKSFEEVDAADRNTQAATYALMVARAWGVDEIGVSIVYRATWRRASHATLGMLDLDAHAARLRQLQLDVAKARVTPIAFLSDGPHCKYCECQLDCPRWESLRKQAGSGELALMTEAAIPFEDDNDAADAFGLLGRLKTLTARLTAALYARAKERAIPLPDGKVLGERVKEGKRRIDGDKAYALIRQKYGTEVADASVRRTVAQKWIEDAIKAAGIPGAAKAKSAIVKQLEESGAVQRDTKTVIEVFDPTKALAAAGDNQ